VEVEVIEVGPKCLWVSVPVFLPYIRIYMHAKNILRDYEI
jgi:hypothetical protein